MSSWKDDKEYNYSVLDKIDILPYLEPGRNLDDIKNKLEEDNINLVRSESKLEGYLFKFINTGDFVGYLENRYPGLYFYTYTEVYVGGR